MVKQAKKEIRLFCSLDHDVLYIAISKLVKGSYRACNYNVHEDGEGSLQSKELPF